MSHLHRRKRKRSRDWQYNAPHVDRISERRGGAPETVELRGGPLDGCTIGLSAQSWRDGRCHVVGGSYVAMPLDGTWDWEASA